MGSAGALSGALRVNVLIRRGLREDAKSGALTGRAHARKGPPAMFGMPLCPSGANFSRRQCESREELIGIHPT
jgi:hypothetical protein